jgi:hypothetical protein
MLVIHVSSSLSHSILKMTSAFPAVALAKYFELDEPDALRGKSVLELASGTGALGLSVSLPPISAASVVLTDKSNMVRLSVCFLQRTAKLSACRGGAATCHCVCVCVCVSYYIYI